MKIKFLHLLLLCWIGWAQAQNTHGFLVGTWTGISKMRQTPVSVRNQHAFMVGLQLGYYYEKRGNITLTQEYMIPFRKPVPDTRSFGWNTYLHVRLNLTGDGFLALYWLQEVGFSNYYSTALDYMVVRVRSEQPLLGRRHLGYNPWGIGLATKFGDGFSFFVETSGHPPARNGAHPFRGQWRLGATYGF